MYLDERKKYIFKIYTMIILPIPTHIKKSLK